MLVWVESFESDECFIKKSVTGTIVTNPAGGRQAGSARTGTFTLSSGARYLIHPSVSEQDDYFVLGRAFQAQSPITSGAIAVFYGDAGATTHVTVWMDVTSSGATFSVYRGDHATGVLLGSLIITNSSFWFLWTFIEVAARLSDTVGTVDIWFDDTNVLSLSGIDTKNGGSATVFDTVEAGGPGPYGVIDDLYLVNEQGSINNSRLGPVRIFAEPASGNGSSSQGVGSDGDSINNYQPISDNVPSNMGSSNSTYVDLQNTGDKDTYAFVDIAFAGISGASPVKGVFVWAVAEKTDAGARGLQLVSHLSGSEDIHDYPALLNSSFETAGALFETKPGGGAWTVADVNNAEFGIVAT